MRGLRSAMRFGLIAAGRDAAERLETARVSDREPPTRRSVPTIISMRNRCPFARLQAMARGYSAGADRAACPAPGPTPSAVLGQGAGHTRTVLSGGSGWRVPSWSLDGCTPTTEQSGISFAPRHLRRLGRSLEENTAASVGVFALRTCGFRGSTSQRHPDWPSLPPPVQPGGPPILSGAAGARSWRWRLAGRHQSGNVCVGGRRGTGRRRFPPCEAFAERVHGSPRRPEARFDDSELS